MSDCIGCERRWRMPVASVAGCLGQPHGADCRGTGERRTNDLATVEVRLAASRRLSVELAAANRCCRRGDPCALDRLLRQHRRLEGARTPAIPRELVEPKGFTDRASVVA